jgi:hypothetical protein
VPASIQCKCSFSNEAGWHCQWATLGADAKIDRQVVFSVTPREFIDIISYLQRVVGHPAEPAAQPDLDALTLRLRYRRNAKLYECQVQSQAGGFHVMVDEPQVARILDYLKSCLQAYAVAIYEGRVPVPEGYPEGYPEPRWG